MRLLIVVHNSMFDAALPLIRRLRAMCDLSCLLEFDIEESNIFGIVESDFAGKFYAKATECEKIKMFEDFLPIDKTTIIKCYPPRSILNHFKTQHYEYKVLKRMEKDIDFIYFYNTPLQSSLYIAFCNKMWGTAVHDPIPHSDQKHVFIRSLISYPVTKRCKNYFLFSDSLVKPFRDIKHITTQNVFLTKLGPYETLGEYNNKHSGEPHDDLRLLFFGKIKAYKGLKYLLQAYKLLVDEKLKLSLTIAGSGFIEPDIVDLNRTPGLEIYNRYITNSELAGLIQDCDLVVCPYTDATQSGVIMSSFAFCKPVLATNVGGLSEMVIDNQNGRLVTPCDSQVIYNTLKVIMNDMTILEKWKNNIFEEYHNGNSSWNHISQNLLATINSILMESKKAK